MPAKGLGKGGTRPSSGTGDVRSKSKISVDKVAGDAESALRSGGGTIERKGLVGSGLKGGTGTARGDVLNGLRD